MAAEHKKHLILAVVKKYPFKLVKPFILTLMKSGFKGDLVLFTSELNENTRNELGKYGAKLIDFTDEYPYIAKVSEINGILPKQAKSVMGLSCSRNIMYYLFLLKHRNNYSKVMLTDVRDVIIQRDPFDFEGFKGLCCFLEDKAKTIGSCKINSGWVLEAFDEKVLKEIGDNYISCAGVVYGTVPAMLEYLKNMIEILTRIEAKWAFDQAVHNYLIRTNKLKEVTLFENENGPVYTVGDKKFVSFHFNEDDQIVSDEGVIVNVIHQYDRHPELIDRLFRKYQLDYNRLMLKNLISKNPTVKMCIKKIYDRLPRIIKRYI